MRKDTSTVLPTMSELPDFCQVGILYLTIIACLLLAFLMALVIDNWRLSFWLNLSSYALFNLWTALTSVGILCLIKKRFAALNLQQFSLVALITTVLVAIIYSLVLMIYLTGEINLWTLFRNTAIAFIVSSIFFRYYYLQQYNQLKIQAEAEARVQALQSRIRPHFLFNSLNTLANLAPVDSQKTEESILDLADIFRASMQRSDKLIPFADEKQLCNQYLQLEKQRLGEKLVYEWQTDTIRDSVPFPPLLLQPIIENAVYHGVQNRTDGGKILIKGLSTKKDIQLEITNPLPSSTETIHKGNSLALKNIRQRLEVLYQGRAELNYHQSADTFYCIIKVPKKASFNFE